MRSGGRGQNKRGVKLSQTSTAFRKRDRTILKKKRNGADVNTRAGVGKNSRRVYRGDKRGGVGGRGDDGCTEKNPCYYALDEKKAI